MSVYYNENDPFAAAWLRELIRAGLLPEGEVDDRSIVDVRPEDLWSYNQCHFFAGIGGWAHALALALAGWPDDREVWTGSCPCQPLSVAGQGRGHADERHLWPAFYRLIAERRPTAVFGEQVAGKDGREWLAGVRADLEDAGYACGAAVMPACAVGAPHQRERLFWVADAGFSGGKRNPPPIEDKDGRQSDAGIFGGNGSAGGVGDAAVKPEREPHNQTDTIASGRTARSIFGGASHWDDAEWLTGADGKTRRVKPGIRLLVDGFPNRVGALRGLGNAIVPPLAAEFVKAFMEC